ncbi:SRPBCC family protein [Actinoplanes sp. NPDC051411]|uniref:SRPBCC family protein n=1 Tax=Actinoplanes sp. NPDC051411 TaxID=3155522 RepID=UPI003420F5B3
MSTVAVARTIDAPVEAVWRVVTDVPGRAGWLTAVRRAELRTPGPFRAGTVWAETRTAAGGDAVTEEFRVIEAVEPERFVVTSPGTGADYRMTYTFQRRRGGTLVTVTQDGTPTAPAGRFLTWIFGALAAETASSALRRDLDDLADAA